MLANVDGVERGWGVGYIIPYYIKGLATASILRVYSLSAWTAPKPEVLGQWPERKLWHSAKSRGCFI